MNKRGQITIFIILALIVVAAILLFIFFTGEEDVITPTELGPENFIDKCVRDAVENSVETVLKNGGEILPSLAIAYQGSEWNYLCYQADYYLPCYNLHPMLEKQIEGQIVLDTQDDIQNCFNTLREDFESRGYSVRGGSTSYSIDLVPGNVKINLQKKIDVSQAGASQSFENFNTRISSPIYDLVQVARAVVNSESQFCNFEYNGYMLLYPQYDIRRVDYKANKMYRIIDRKTGAEFKFATRSCAFAPGI